MIRAGGVAKPAARRGGAGEAGAVGGGGRKQHFDRAAFGMKYADRR